MKRIIKEFKEALTTKTGTSAYDTTAEVIRVDGSTLWVHIPGGVDETPVRKTVDAKEGDTIQVRVGGGSAWATGNASAPPTDDSTAKVAKETADVAKNKAGKAQIIANSAWKKADFALVSANGKNTVYYSASEPTAPETGFKVGDTWFDTANDYQINEWDGSDWVPFQLGEDAIADLAITNAKIADATIQSAKIAGLDVGKLTGGYIDAGHINTLSLSVGGGRTLGDELDDMNDEIDDVYPYITYIDSTYGVRVYRGDKSVAANQTYYSQMNAGGFDVVANNVTLAHIGYASGDSGSSTPATAPYYTFGKRKSDTSSTRGNYSVAEGYNSTASGFGSHAEGSDSEAQSTDSHAEGSHTLASGLASHAGGLYTITNGTARTAIGSYNVDDRQVDTFIGDGITSDFIVTKNIGTRGDGFPEIHVEINGGSTPTGPISVNGRVVTLDEPVPASGAVIEISYPTTSHVLVIGNGSGNSARSNAFAVDWDGVARLNGNLFTGCSSDSTGGYEFGRKTGNHIVVGGIHICWGQKTITHTGSGYKEETVTLPYTYTSAPNCFASYGNRPLGGAARTAYATQSDLAGNKIYVGSYATGSVTAYVNWMTIGA